MTGREGGRKPPAPSGAKKASGRYVTDGERNTVKVTLRLDPELAERLRAIHGAWRARDRAATLGDVLEAALDALDGTMAEP